jgi:acyl carrier protein
MTSSSSTSTTFDRVSAEVLSILRDDLNVDVSRVTQDARLVDDVGLDSVAFAVGMVAIEERLGVSLSEEELLNCDTVGDLQAAVAAKYRDE